jgi:exodeoxyribonuclease VII small subunit
MIHPNPKLSAEVDEIDISDGCDDSDDEMSGLRSVEPVSGVPAKDVSFEDAIRRLGHIVEQLERGDLPLEGSLGLFEEGIRLARVSQRRLDRAERRIEELLGVAADGDPITRPFEAKLDGG